MPRLDLNASRAARAAQRGEPMTVELGEPPATFRLKDELPVEVTEKATAGDVVGAMKALLADPNDWEKIRTLDLTYDDILSIVEFYGTSLGESQRLATTSKTNGPPSRPTSSGTTGSTSPLPSGVPSPSQPQG